MCKVYVEVYKNLIPKVIKKKDWEEKKKYFAQTLDTVADKEPQLKPYVGTILGYHSIRNDLYHSGKPIKVDASVVDDYSELTRTVLDILLKVSENKDTQDKRTASIHSALLGEAKKEIKAGVNFEDVNDAVRFLTAVNVNLPDAICLILHGFPMKKGQPPTFNELQASLALSGHMPKKEILRSRISELRQRKMVSKAELTLTSLGRKELLKKYLS